MYSVQIIYWLQELYLWPIHMHVPLPQRICVEKIFAELLSCPSAFLLSAVKKAQP